MTNALVLRMRVAEELAHKGHIDALANDAGTVLQSARPHPAAGCGCGQAAAHRRYDRSRYEGLRVL